MEVTINDGRIREYDVNVRLEHKIYSQIYNILLAVRDGRYVTLNGCGFEYDLTKICNEFWNNKDKDIID